MTSQPTAYPRHRFPAEIISHAVWLYHVFSLSLRDVELILAERGVIVTRESIRHWCRKFGADFAGRLRRRRPRPGDTWHLDEVFIRIRGVLHYLWRAWTRTAWCWTSWCRSGGMGRQRRVSSNGCCTACCTNRGAWSPTACAATALPSAPFCRTSGTGPAGISTIAPKTRTGQRDDESGRCNGSSRPIRRSNSCSLTV